MRLDAKIIFSLNKGYTLWHMVAATRKAKLRYRVSAWTKSPQLLPTSIGCKRATCYLAAYRSSQEGA
eukprot:2730393-Pyramimonas_sp.AAC.1